MFEDMDDLESDLACFAPVCEFAYAEEDLPARASMRRSLLKANGRRKGLHDLWDSPRFDSGRRSRSFAYRTRKDFRQAKDTSYRPWQSADINGIHELAAVIQAEEIDYYDAQDERQEQILSDALAFQADDYDAYWRTLN